MDLDDDLPRDAERDDAWSALGEESQDVERVPAGELAAGDRIVMGGQVVTLEAVMIDGERVWVRAGEEKVHAPVDAEVERVR